MKIDKEICICAAVKTTTGEIIRGHRHGDCFITIDNLGLKIGKNPSDQGFMTSNNRFVNRVESLKIQKRAGVKSADIDGYRPNILFSEDLY